MDKTSEQQRRGEGIRFERIRRITGYLVGTTDRWNNAKKAELADRCLLYTSNCNGTEAALITKGTGR